MAKMASASGRHGLSAILQTRDEPLPLRSESRVVEAWAMMFPPLYRQHRNLLMEACSFQCDPVLTLASWRLRLRTGPRRLELLLDS